MDLKNCGSRKDATDPSAISRLLGKDHDRFKIEYHKSIASTNTYAKELARQGAENGFTVLADSQSGGRGRLGRSFFSPEGSGIYMSVVLRPKMNFADSLKITAFAAVCVSDAIDALFGTESQIKWVNDIIIGNKKVCGILAEAGIDAQAPRLEYIVLGIGINVKRTAFPQELSEIAGSIEDFSDKTVSKNQLIAEILKNLSPLLDGEIPSDTMDRYRSRSLFLGRSVFTLSEPSVSGVAVEIDDGGALIIRSSDGALHKIAAGEVSVRSL